uniref:FA complementation group F n=3 Tax=Arion vulgaris TaxID=1028688 RepID=A0A0B7B089_9EUPU
MSASIILKNIFEFAKILNRASHQSVTHWDDQSLRNALDWADYCQELFHQIKGQEYEEDVNSQLSQMAVFLNPVSCLRLSVDTLGCARTQLVQTLMSNTKFPPLSQKKLISILQRSPDGVRVLEEVQKKCSDKCLQVCTDLLNSLTDRCHASYLQNIRSDYQAQVLLHNLVAALQNVQKVQRFEKYCCNVYNKLAETQEGWNILVCLFTVDVCGLPCSEAMVQEKVLKDFLSRMTQEIKQDVVASYLWSVPIDVLIKASSISEQFFLTYLDALVALGDSFSPQIDCRGFISWRSPSGHTLQELCLRFQRELESSVSVCQDRKVKILETVTSHVEATDYTVWKELGRNLLQLFKR